MEDRENVLRENIVGRLHVGEADPEWSGLFKRKSLSEVWDKAEHYAPMLWLLKMTGYYDDRYLRKIASWAFEETALRFVRHAQPARILHSVVEGYIDYTATREKIYAGWEHYCDSVRRVQGESQDFERGISSAHSVLKALVISEPYSCAVQALNLAEDAIRREASYHRHEGGHNVVVAAGESFAKRAANVMRVNLREPFGYWEEGKQRRVLRKLREVIKIQSEREEARKRGLSSDGTDYPEKS